MKYGLYVYCRRNGVSRDAGLQSTCEAVDEKDAIQKLYPDVAWLKNFYDEVSWEVKEIEEPIP